MKTIQMLTSKELKTLQALKKWCAKNRITIHSSASGDNVIISFKRSRNWFYLRTGNSNRSWEIKKSFTLTV